MDVVAYGKHRLNYKHKDKRNGFLKIFRGIEAEIQSIAAHNIHENVGRIQEGSTSMLLYGPLVDQYDSKHYGKDDTGLGRWVVVVLKDKK